MRFPEIDDFSKSPVISISVPAMHVLLFFYPSHIIHHYDGWRNTVIRNPTWSHLRSFLTETKKVLSSNCVLGRARCLYVCDWRIRISTEYFAVFCSGTFVPSIPQIAQDFNSTGEVIRYVISFISDTTIRTLWFSYAVSVYILAASCGGLIGSVYSKFCEHEYIISDLWANFVQMADAPVTYGVSLWWFSVLSVLHELKLSGNWWFGGSYRRWEHPLDFQWEPGWLVIFIGWRKEG